VRLARTKADAGRIANEAYRSSGVLSGIAIAMDAETPNDLIDRAHVVQTAMGVQNSAADRVRREQEEIEARRVHLEAVRERIRGLRAEAEANLEAARRAEQEAAERQAEVERLVAQAEETARVVAARREQETARLRSLEAEQEGLRAELARRAREARARASAGERASRSSGRGILASPVGALITSHYGYRTHPVYGSRRMHSGTDFGASCGTPVRAAAAGTVVRAGGAGGYGNQIVLDHGLVAGSALATSYNHLQGFAVRSGSVSRGQVIGYIGTTGTSTGCHLHFEVFDGGATVDPMRWL
jgi:murein DD-endopeptidase MepM/ murein hydrolase activator NlpD